MYVVDQRDKARTVRRLFAVQAADISLSRQGPYTLKLDVPVVSIDVTVLDSKNNLINDLTRDDFLVYENAIPQGVRFFSPVSAPYNGHDPVLQERVMIFRP